MGPQGTNVLMSCFLNGLCVPVKNCSGDILYLSFCQQIPLKRPNEISLYLCVTTIKSILFWLSESKTEMSRCYWHTLFVQPKPLISYSSALMLHCCSKSTVSHTFALGDMFYHYKEHGHCILVSHAHCAANSLTHEICKQQHVQCIFLPHLCNNLKTTMHTVVMGF